MCQLHGFSSTDCRFGVCLSSKYSSIITYPTVSRLHLKLRVEGLQPFPDGLLSLLQVLDLLEQDVGEVADVTRLACLLDFEQFVVSQREGSELCTELLGSGLQLLVELFELFLLLGQLFEGQVHCCYAYNYEELWIKYSGQVQTNESFMILVINSDGSSGEILIWYMDYKSPSI